MASEGLTPSTVPDSDRFILVNLISKNSQKITLAVDRLDASIVGYMADTKSYFYKDETLARDSLFSGSVKTELPYTNAYGDIEKAACTSRPSIKLGVTQLDKAIMTLHKYESPVDVAQAFIVVMQMVSEAARFKSAQTEIEQLIADGNDRYPSNMLLRLEDRWQSVPKEMQSARLRNNRFDDL